MTTDSLDIITDVNQQMEEVTGYTREELIGSPFKNYFTDPARAEEGIRLVLRESKVTNYELTARGKDGVETVVFYNAATFYDRDGKLQGVFAAARDVTERKRFDQTLQEKNLELESANFAKNQFLATMSHELHTPLTGIIGYADLLRTDYESLDKAAIGRMADQIVQCSQRLYRVVENYLVYAQVEVFRRDPQAMATISTQRTSDPGTVIRETVMQKTWTSGRKDDVTVRVEDANVRISHKSLCKIVDELVDNALKFSEPGTPIEVVGEATDGIYTLSIRDGGRGMTAAEISRIGAYMQFERALYEQQGLGLGLIVAKNLAELHGGRLSIQSTTSEGTTVRVELLV